MLITYDSTTDILYIELRRLPVHDAAEVEQGITIMLDKDRHVLGIEIMQAKERIGVEQMRNIIIKDLAFDTSAGIGPDFRPPVPIYPPGQQSPNGRPG